MPRCGTIGYENFDAIDFYDGYRHYPSFPNVLIGNLSLFYFRPLIETFKGDD